MSKEAKNVETLASHYLLASIGKRVLRPGGKELTKYLIESLQVQKNDKVVEFAPGLGYTTNIVLAKHPSVYIGIELDENRIHELESTFKNHHNGVQIKFILGDAESTGLAESSSDKAFGEAMLSMHADQRKSRIIKEAARILKTGGLYAIHELELNLIGENPEKQEKIQRDLAHVSHVNARPLTITEWSKLLENEGFEVISVERRPLKVLDPTRIIADEGILQTLKIMFNILSMPKARKRVLAMRKIFKQHDKHLNAVAILAKKVI